jgi:hypothetical protein
MPREISTAFVYFPTGESAKNGRCFATTNASPHFARLPPQVLKTLIGALLDVYHQLMAERRSQ